MKKTNQIAAFKGEGGAVDEKNQSESERGRAIVWGQPGGQGCVENVGTMVWREECYCGDV